MSALVCRGLTISYNGRAALSGVDLELPEGCQCASVITGRKNPDECPMFGTGCDPVHPFGPCMVSAEGACGIWFRNKRS